MTKHFGGFPLSPDSDEMRLPEWIRKPVGPLALKPAQKQVSVYFNLDNGGGRIRGVYLQGNFAVEPIFSQWIAPLMDMGVTTFTQHGEFRTDHISFDNVGIPAFQFIQDPLDYHSRTHHSNMDTYESLQPDDLEQAAAVEAIFVLNAAMRDEMLPRKPLPALNTSISSQSLGSFPDGAQEAGPKSTSEDPSTSSPSQQKRRTVSGRE